MEILWDIVLIIVAVIVIDGGIALLLKFFNSEWWASILDRDARKEYKQEKAERKAQETAFKEYLNEHGGINSLFADFISEMKKVGYEVVDENVNDGYLILCKNVSKEEAYVIGIRQTSLDEMCAMVDVQVGKENNREDVYFDSESDLPVNESYSGQRLSGIVLAKVEELRKTL